LRIAQLNGQCNDAPDWSAVYGCATPSFRADCNYSATPPSKPRIVIAQSKRIKLSGSKTLCRSASDTARGPASGFSSPDAVVEQRHT
jgi:hypothetical protein